MQSISAFAKNRVSQPQKRKEQHFSLANEWKKRKKRMTCTLLLLLQRQRAFLLERARRDETRPRLNSSTAFYTAVHLRRLLKVGGKGGGMGGRQARRPHEEGNEGEGGAGHPIIPSPEHWLAGMSGTSYTFRHFHDI